MPTKTTTLKTIAKPKVSIPKPKTAAKSKTVAKTKTAATKPKTEVVVGSKIVFIDRPKVYNYVADKAKCLSKINLTQIKRLNTMNKAKAGYIVKFTKPVTDIYVRDVEIRSVYNKDSSVSMGPLSGYLYDCLYGHCGDNVYKPWTYGYIENINYLTKEAVDEVRFEANQHLDGNGYF